MLIVTFACAFLDLVEDAVDVGVVVQHVDVCADWGTGHCQQLLQVDEAHADGEHRHSLTLQHRTVTVIKSHGLRGIVVVVIQTMAMTAVMLSLIVLMIALSMDATLALSSLTRSGELRTQKLRSHLIRTQSLKVLLLQPSQSILPCMLR